jgi:hypothetical protein
MSTVHSDHSAAESKRSFDRSLAQRRKRKGPVASRPLSTDLREVEEAWRKYQGTHDRDAEYGYLGAVYNLVREWKSERRARKSAGLA